MGANPGPINARAGRGEHRPFLSATPHYGHFNGFSTLLEILDRQRITRGVKVWAKDLEPVMICRLKDGDRSALNEDELAQLEVDAVPSVPGQLHRLDDVIRMRSGRGDSGGRDRS